MLREAEVSSAALLEAFVDNVARHDRPHVNAVSVLDLEYARVRARQADEALAGGVPLGRLHGLPMTIKNLPACATMAEDHEQLFDRLEKAGAVVYGRTNLPVNAQDVQTYNPEHGTTGNPWDVGRTAGGSSGGSAAALAACFTPLEVGSDIGGSIRVPASHCGVFGHKPTFGVVCPRGTTRVTAGLATDMSVRGPMARTADDLALLLDVLLTTDTPPRTDYSVLWLPRPRKTLLREYRVAVWDSQRGFPLCKEVRAAVDAVVAVLQREGAVVDRAARPAFDSAMSHRLYLQLLGATVTTGTDWAESSEWTRRQQQRGDADADAELLRAVGGRLWQANWHGSRNFVIEHSVSQTHRQWHAADRQRHALRLRWREFFQRGGVDDGGFDAVLMPIYPVPAIRHNHAEGDLVYPHTLYGPLWRPTHGRSLAVDNMPTAYHDAIFWSGVANLAYLPSTAFPAGRGVHSKLPIGLQLVGPEGGDYCTIALAGLLERAGFGCEFPATPK
jgi:amidase